MPTKLFGLIPLPGGKSATSTVLGGPAAIGPLDEVGATGTEFYSGFLDAEEYNVDLQGDKAIQTYTRMMRSDGTVKAMMRVMVLPFLSAILKVDPASDGDKDVHIANVVEHMLLNMKGQAWKKMLRQILTSAFGYGFAVHEKVFTTPDGKPNIDEIDGEKVIALYKLAPRLSKSIYRWHIDRSGELRGITQKTFVSANEPGFEVEAKDSAPGDYTSGGQWKFPQIPIERLFVFAMDQEGSNYRGESILRSAYKHWYYKDNLLRIQAVAAERHGVGIPYAILKAGIRPPEKKAVADALQRLHAHEKGYFLASEEHLAAGTASFPPFGILDMKATGLKSLDTAILYCDRQMAVSIMADFIALGSGIGGNANVMQRDKSSFFFNLLRGVGDEWEDCFNAMVVRQIVDLNWPGVAAYPKARLTSLETKDFERLGRSMAQMATADILSPDAEMEDQIREMLDLPLLPKDDDGNPIRPEKPIPPPSPVAGVVVPPTIHPGVIPGSPGTPDAGVVPGPTPTVPDEPFAPMSEHKWHRELRPAERRVDFAAIDDALTQGVAKLKTAGAEPTATLAKQLAAHKGTKQAQRKLASALKPVLLDLQQFGYDQVKREYARAKGKKLDDNGPPELPDVAVGALGTALAAKVAERLQYWLDNYEGEPTEEEIAAAGDSALAFVARLAATTPLNDGRSEAANELKTDIEYAERSALLDERTCDSCEALDGSQYQVDTAEYDDNEPPSMCAGGDMCRCVYVFVWSGTGEGD